MTGNTAFPRGKIREDHVSVRNAFSFWHQKILSKNEKKGIVRHLSEPATVFTILQGVFLVTVHWLLWVHPRGSRLNSEEGGSGNAWIRKTSFPKNCTIGSCFYFMTAQKEVRKRGLKIKGGLAKQKCLWPRPSGGSCKNGHPPSCSHLLLKKGPPTAPHKFKFRPSGYAVFLNISSKG